MYGRRVFVLFSVLLFSRLTCSFAFFVSLAVLSAAATSLKAKMCSWPEHGIEKLKCNVCAFCCASIWRLRWYVFEKMKLNEKKYIHKMPLTMKLSYQESDASSNAFSLNCKVFECVISCSDWTFFLFTSITAHFNGIFFSAENGHFIIFLCVLLQVFT